MLRKILICAALVAATSTVNAAPVLVEGFDNVAGLGASGWTMTNNSAPVGATNWFQGNTGIFDSYAGSADSYIAANFENAGFGGNVDNWLLTPLLTDIGSVTSMTFATRTAGTFPGDTLSVYYNTTGSLNLADYVLVGTLSAAYPDSWTLFTTGNIGNFMGETLRFAFRYTVTDTSAAGDYIGIDSVTVHTNVPEPGSLALLAACLLMAPLALRRRRQRQI